MNAGAVSYSLQELVERFGGEIVGDPAVRVSRVATLDNAAADAVAFLANPRYRKQLGSTKAGAVIIGPGHRDDTSCPRIVHEDPYVCFARVSALLAPPRHARPGIHPTAVVDPQAHVDPGAEVGPHASIGRAARIGPGAVIGAGSTLGENTSVGRDCHLHANVSIYGGCTLGERVIVHSGAVIGADGFGIAFDRDHWVKVPQIGGVRIGNDVEIGASTTIDRGAIEDTVIEDGVKLDNLVQIAHNVRVGAHTVMAGTAAIAGSTKIGKRCMIAGGAAVINSIVVCDDVTLTVRAVVTKDIDKPGVYSGLFPAEEAAKWRRDVARFRRLEELAARVTAAEQRLAELTKTKKDE